jgi:hypothetical protein
MITRAQLDAALDELAQKLPPWREKLRHEAQFWPQFDALAGEILAQAETQDLAHAQRRIAAMLAAHGLRRDARDR